MKRFIFIAFVIMLSASGFECVGSTTGIIVSGGGGGGGGGGTPTPIPAWTVYKNGYQELTYGDGAYSQSVTITGHAIAIGGAMKRVFDVVSPEGQGQETCISAFGTGGTATDWHYFGQLYPNQSPYTLEGEGQYATGFMDCLGGHVIWGLAWYTWANAQNPHISPSETQQDILCFNLTPLSSCE